MYNPITFIKDIIDLVREPAGEAVAALEITSENKQFVLDQIGDPRAEKYANPGDFLLELESIVTICPRKEFFKHYEFTHEPSESKFMTPVRTIKPI